MDADLGDASVGKVVPVQAGESESDSRHLHKKARSRYACKSRTREAETGDSWDLLASQSS